MKLNVLFHVGYYDNLFSPIDRELGGTEQVLLNTVKSLFVPFVPLLLVATTPHSPLAPIVTV
jgi:hypothetical protein